MLSGLYAESMVNDFVSLDQRVKLIPAFSVLLVVLANKVAATAVGIVNFLLESVLIGLIGFPIAVRT